MTLAVVAWKWGQTFEARHVNILRAMLARHLHLDHRLYCVTDRADGIDGDVEIVPLPEAFRDTPRCRRRMLQYSREFRSVVGPRMLAIDLDVVIVDDLTPIVSRPDPIVGWKVGHAGVYSGSFLLCDTGALHGAYEAFANDPTGYPRSIQPPPAVPSDQAMLNHYIRSARLPVWTLTERDGFVTYYGKGYERLEHLGVGPNRPQLPSVARIVVLGSADIAVLDEHRFDWVDQHWRAA